MRLANSIFTYDHLYDPWQHYAIELLYAISDQYPKEWALSWRYDAYLGNACVFARRYDERYKAYRQAMTKVSPPPPELLVALASCNSTPGTPPVSQQEAIKILTEIALKKPYKDVVRMLVRGFYNKLQENPKEFAFWNSLYQTFDEMREEEKFPDMIPESLENNIETDLSKLPLP